MKTFRTPGAAGLPAILAAAFLSVPQGIGKPGFNLPLPEWQGDEGAGSPSLTASLFPVLRSETQRPKTASPTESPTVPPIPPRDPNAPFQPFLEPLELEPLVVLDGGEDPVLEEIAKGPGETEIILEDFQIYRSKPGTFLVNPQYLLSEPQKFDLTEFLDYHASESGIPIYLLVVDGTQRMPDRFDLTGTVDDWFLDVPACVVLYYLGYPTRSEVVLSPPLRNVTGSASAAEIREHASTDALVASDPVDQLSRFAVRTSIRMFWLEKQIRNPESVKWAEEGSHSTVAAALSALGALFKSANFYAALLGLAALVAALYLARSWWIARTGGRVYVFPDFELAPRFGAPHSGGAHIVVDFERRD